MNRQILIEPSDPRYADDRHTYHLVNGLGCGYPLCCVLYFCSIFQFWSTGNYSDDFNKSLESDEGKLDNNSHALCPECSIKKMEKIAASTRCYDTVVVNRKSGRKLADNDGKARLVRCQLKKGHELESDHIFKGRSMTVTWTVDPLLKPRLMQR